MFVTENERPNLPYKNVSKKLSQKSDFDRGPCEYYKKFRVPSQNNFSLHTKNRALLLKLLIVI